MSGPDVRVAGIDELTARQLHDLLKLRGDVFVVEQACAYADLDGRDIEPTTRHFWVEDRGAVVACLRRLREPDGTVRLGRIATRADARKRGLADRLLAAASAGVDGPVVLDAQEQLEGWYRARGFERTGPTYVEDGIPHVPMRRNPAKG